MASVFWDSEGVLMIDYLERGKTVTSVYYAELIRTLCKAIKEKRRGKLTQGVLLHHDNAPAHTSHVAMAAINECGLELLCHPPYSPDLAPSDFHLFRFLKDSLHGQVLQSDKVVIQATNEWIEEQEQRFFVEGVKALEYQWEKCVALRVDMLKNCDVILILVDSFYVFLIT
jgi:histone-lysine N-methyltransferase SETMAR